MLEYHWIVFDLIKFKDMRVMIRERSTYIFDVLQILSVHFAVGGSNVSSLNVMSRISFSFHFDSLIRYLCVACRAQGHVPVSKIPNEPSSHWKVDEESYEEGGDSENQFPLAFAVIEVIEKYGSVIICGCPHAV